MPKVSVIIPVYNGARYLAATIESVLQQSLRDWEMVIVDDGSTDPSATIARYYALRESRIHFIAQNNRGIAAARNRGLLETDPASHWVIFLDQDDIWEPDALDVLGEELLAHPEASAAHGLVRYIDSHGNPTRPAESYYLHRRGIIGMRPVTLTRGEFTTFGALVRLCCIRTVGLVMIRRSALERAGLFDSEMVPSDDWDLWLRLSSLGPIGFVDAVVLNYRWHDGNASLNSEAMARASDRLYKKLLASPRLTPGQQQTALLGQLLSKRDRAGDSSRARWAWANGSLAHHQWGAAARQLRHALAALLEYHALNCRCLLQSCSFRLASSSRNRHERSVDNQG